MAGKQSSIPTVYATTGTNATLFPILVLLLAAFGHSIIREALPPMPFLLPTGALLLIYFFLPNGKFPTIIRGFLKTALALFFVFAAIQNALSFQIRQSFLPLPHNALQDMVNESTTFHPLGRIESPRFIVISFADHVPICTTPSADLNKRYAREITASANVVELSEKFAKDMSELHCVELIPIFQIDKVITIGVTPDWTFSNPNTTSNNPFGLLRALHTLSQRSVLFLPSFVIDTYHAVISKYQLSNKLPYLSTTTPPQPSTSTQAFITITQNLTQFQHYMLIGFLLCMAGDVLLIFGSNDLFFVFGLASFLLGHVNFTIGYLYVTLHVRTKHLPSFPILSVFWASIFAFIAWKLYFYIGSAGKLKGPLKWAVILYLIVIATMVSSACIIGFAVPPTQAPLNSVARAVYNSEFEYKPLIHDALAHVISICVRAPMYISTQIAYLLGLTPHNPTSIAQVELFSHFTISNESFCALFLTFGSILFMISDIYVARQKFVQESYYNQAIGLTMYFISNLLLASTVQYM